MKRCLANISNHSPTNFCRQNLAVKEYFKEVTIGSLVIPPLLLKRTCKSDGQLLVNLRFAVSKKDTKPGEMNLPATEAATSEAKQISTSRAMTADGRLANGWQILQDKT